MLNQFNKKTVYQTESEKFYEKITPSEHLLFYRPLPSFPQDIPVNMKRLINSRHSRIGGQLEKDLSNFSWVTANIQRCIYVEFQFICGA